MSSEGPASLTTSSCGLAEGQRRDLVTKINQRIEQLAERSGGPSRAPFRVGAFSFVHFINKGSIMAKVLS